ncbi:alcohol dehydrogenase-like regulatory protein ErcA [Methanobacterium formicicum]|uniref:Iron-containing alcohol dehydrogenase n=1 Tax=Methanobacterium formicicum (strain DSM 3637 / PP1) TaxID=1204725 RepID=K2QCC1_METFP|nr:alcohol dehydrogenase-like regulatory protein ErcA [Methanobacterium formicicum]EKF85656.1 iron-containing alcohol dehydrogenase [Methanobacterium formicicum DSM 3637]
MGNVLELRKFVAPEFIFGSGARLLVGRYAKNFGARKILIVTDPHILASGLLRPVFNVLEEEQINYVIYSDIKSNPTALQVMEGANFYLTENCNFIVAVGGGSAMDCAKAIGIVSSNKKEIYEFEGVDKVPIPSPPLICIPTTAGSAADVSQFAIITDSRRKLKMAIVSKAVVPDVALIDPETTLTMDKSLTIVTGFDVLSHAVEAFVSNASSPITDLHALEAIKLVASNLIPVSNDLDNIELRAKMMLSSLNAGLAFSNSSLGLVHAMAHSLGGFLDLPHGECNALLLDQVVKFNFEAESEKYKEIARALGLEIDGMNDTEIKTTLINGIRDLKLEAGINYSLKDVGVATSDIPELAGKAMNDACIITNPRRPTQKDVEEIFKNAL